MEDYYSILGLDPGASPDSIKLAYRRLAREFHPDRNIDSTEGEKAAQSTQMVRLNEAYNVLSDSRRRREYDDKLRTLGMLKTSSDPLSSRAPTRTATATVSARATSTVPRTRIRPARDVDSTVVRDFSTNLRDVFLNTRKGLDWEEVPLEGFDWGLEAVSWSSHYCVAARSFPVLDPAAIKKFVNYSEVAVAQRNRTIRKSYFLFILLFQQVSEWEAVSTRLQAALSSAGPSRTYGAPAVIVLFDIPHGRILRFGSQFNLKPFEQMLQYIGPGK